MDGLEPGPQGSPVVLPGTQEGMRTGNRVMRDYMIQSPRFINEYKDC